MKIPIQTEDIRVSKILLDLYLTTDLLLDAGLDDFGFVQTFKGKDVFGLALGADHVNATKLALTERSTDVKGRKIPFTGRTDSGIQMRGTILEMSHQTYRDTLESNARASAASPYTFSPLFSLSISKPPSYRPISSPACAASFVGEGGSVVGCVLVSLVVDVGFRSDDGGFVLDVE